MTARKFLGATLGSDALWQKELPMLTQVAVQAAKARAKAYKLTQLTEPSIWIGRWRLRDQTVL